MTRHETSPLLLDFCLRQRDFVLKVCIESDARTIALFGPSGAGKTTTLEAIAGLRSPDIGSIRVGNKVLFDHQQKINLPAHERCVGYVPQDLALFPHLDVLHNVLYGAPKHGDVDARVIEILEIGNLLQRSIKDLSGGEQQRVALARALAIKPSLLLLDEPLSHLDQELRDSVRTELSTLLKETGTTSIFVSHDTEDALAMADKIVVLNNGKVDQIGSPMEIYSFPLNRYVALLFGKTNFIPRSLIPDSRHYFLDSETNSEVVSVRPHQLRIINENFNINSPSFFGKIISLHPKGDHQEIKLKVKELILTLNLPITYNANIGDDLSVNFQEDFP